MKLTEIQRSIIEAPLGPMLVTAGAGSGKTRVLTHRLAFLLQNGIRDTEIIALTFTNKAAGEMKRRVETMTGGVCNAFLGTFHSFCARVLRSHIYLFGGYNSNFSIYSTTDTQKIIKEIIAAGKFTEFDKDSWKSVEHHLGAMKNAGLGLDEYRKDIQHLDAADDIVRAMGLYDQKLRDSNALDFDDLLVKTLNLFNQFPRVLEQYRTSIRYILVDEFQDTNVIQYKIVARLAAIHKNLMIVGDEDQCIYTWRGASIENINAFRRDFPECKIYKLEENFRSAKNIVTLANVLVSNNDNRLDKVLFSNLADGTIELKACLDERDEARGIAAAIGGAVRRYGAKYSDFAILMRINALSRILEEQLLNFNIPHVIWGGFKFYERAEIKSVVNYLRVLVNPKDEVALIDIINFPRRGVGEASIEKLQQCAARSTLYDVVMNIDNHSEGFSAKALSGIKNFTFTFNALREIHDSFGLEMLAQSLISTVGLDRIFKTSKKEEDLNRLENLYQLEHAMQTFASENPTATLAQYLQSVSLVSDSDAAGGDDSVIISTVHSAKGLEFKNVFIVGLEDGLFPLSRAKNSTAEMEEERRLLYVAITRARQCLYLSYASSRFYMGERKLSLPSPFLIEAGFKIQKPESDFEFGFSSEFEKDEKISGYRQNGGPAHYRHPEEKFVPKDETAESAGISVGDRVGHEKFGEGRVIDIIDKNIIKIQFDNAGMKMLSLAFANLKKL